MFEGDVAQQAASGVLNVFGANTLGFLTFVDVPPKYLTFPGWNQNWWGSPVVNPYTHPTAPPMCVPALGGSSTNVQPIDSPFPSTSSEQLAKI